MQSCVLRVLQHVVDDFETRLSSPRFRPWLAYHEAHGIESAIAVAHGVHNQGADRSVVPDNVFIFAHATIVAALVMVASAKEARHVVLRCESVGGLNSAAHLNEPNVVVRCHPWSPLSVDDVFS